jgi:hypothetical protein
MPYVCPNVANDKTALKLMIRALAAVRFGMSDNMAMTSKIIAFGSNKANKKLNKA